MWWYAPGGHGERLEPIDEYFLNNSQSQKADIM